MAAINYILIQANYSFVSMLHSSLPHPLCIIHHRGVLPCFPGLFLPSMAVTLTESPNPLLLPTTSLPPSGSWITSLISPFFLHIWVILPRLIVTKPSFKFLYWLLFLQHFAALHFLLRISIMHISVLRSLRRTGNASLQKAVGACWAYATAWLTYPASCISSFQQVFSRIAH